MLNYYKCVSTNCNSWHNTIATPLVLVVVVVARNISKRVRDYETCSPKCTCAFPLSSSFLEADVEENPKRVACHLMRTRCLQKFWTLQMRLSRNLNHWNSQIWNLIEKNKFAAWEKFATLAEAEFFFVGFTKNTETKNWYQILVPNFGARKQPISDQFGTKL